MRAPAVFVLASVCIAAFLADAHATGKKEERHRKITPEASYSLFDQLFARRGIRPAQADEPAREQRKSALKRVKPARARPITSFAPTEKVVMSIGGESLVESRLAYIAQAIQVCVLNANVEKRDAIDCPVKEGEDEIEYTLTRACSEYELCLRAVITREWCQSREGVWTIGETQWVCEPKSH